MLNNYKITLVHCPYNHFHKDKSLRDFLSETWKMKLEGFRAYFPYGVLPVDHLDFISNHVVVSKFINNELVPVSGFKSISAHIANLFRIPFPVETHIYGGSEIDFPLFSKVINMWKKNKPLDKMAYNFGYTIDPTLTKEEKKFISALTYACIYFYYKELKIPNIIHWVNNTFKLVEGQRDIGFEKCSYLNEELPPLISKSLFNLEYHLMTMENLQFNPNYIQQIEREFRKVWDNKIVFGSNQIEENQNIDIAS